MANSLLQPEVWIVRHGETEWSRDGRHTSLTDLDLTDSGVAQAEALRPALAGLRPDLVLCSPRRRALRTAELAGLGPVTVDDELREWDYGDLEGLTSARIREDLPGWTIWDGPWPGGETDLEVGARAGRMAERLKGSLAERIVVVGHGHFSRVLAARWVGAPVQAGRWLDLDTATTSLLGWAKQAAVVRRWNVPASTAALA